MKKICKLTMLGASLLVAPIATHAATLTLFQSNTSVSVSNQTQTEVDAAPVSSSRTIGGASASADASNGKISGVASTLGSYPFAVSSSSAGGVLDLFFRNDSATTLMLPKGFLTFAADASYTRSLGLALPLGTTNQAGNAVVASMSLIGPGFTSSSAANVAVSESQVRGTTASPNSSSFGGVTEIAFFSATDSDYLAQFASNPFSIAAGASFRLSVSFNVSASKGGSICSPTNCDYDALANTNGGSTGALTMFLPAGLDAVDANGNAISWARRADVPSPAVVPLPASFAFLAGSMLGLLGLTGLRRRLA